MSNYKEHAAMVDQLMKPGDAILQDLTPIKAERLHMVVGFMGEVTELASAIENLSLYESDEEYDAIMDNLKEELGDCEFYLEGLCQTYGVERIQPSAIVIDNSRNDQNLLHLVIAAGNLLDIVKKEVIYNKDIDVSGELFVATTQLRSLYLHYPEITAESAREANLQKLLKGDKARFKEGSYSNSAAQERADKKV